MGVKTSALRPRARLIRLHHVLGRIRLEQERVHLGVDEIALAGVERIEIDLEQDLDGAEIGQIAGGDQC